MIVSEDVQGPVDRQSNQFGRDGGAIGHAELEAAAASFVNAENGLPTAADCLRGASDILAERMSEDADLRDEVRRIAWQTGRLAVVATKEGQESGQDYRDYFDHVEPVTKLPPHRVLAMNQGEVVAMGTPREVQSHSGVIEAYLGTIDDVSNLRRPAGSSMGVRT